ncbi:dephospho-CoA kinase [Aliivibrio fischeri]|uniref:Dephospho-CoA kinase n=1 Tax=Aliivibrio fischeri (strain MJ11) TaxID=388396 RepID=B5FB24_ALIFM|nr:dephospho-CoA kinase [Aliivibrio fischeri]ACH65288.1 dephospho-CoA kinase [Aliivibrio fischeri MJ11]MUK25200.1 dephospho-CoA kinase [Aliivibrio fischeri]MUK33246.1 dephospho-CoA kinase [Aliivibrio fischeri]MUL02314.1 dephospho-CoA kinase [Aliivibrio fischeri]
MSYVVAITGGIGSGKTTVADRFQALYNINIVDADIIAREVVNPGTEGLIQIEQHFGPQILLDDGHLNRAKLRECIFSEPSEKQWLNDLLHPLIRSEMQRQIALSTSEYTLLVVPLLVENKLQYLANRVLVVDVLEQTQINRTVNRDKVNHQQVKAILASQASREERLAIADDIINNDQQNNDLDMKISLLHEKYLLLSLASINKENE